MRILFCGSYFPAAAEFLRQRLPAEACPEIGEFVGPEESSGKDQQEEETRGHDRKFYPNLFHQFIPGGSQGRVGLWAAI